MNRLVELASVRHQVWDRNNVVVGYRTLPYAAALNEPCVCVCMLAHASLHKLATLFLLPLHQSIRDHSPTERRGRFDRRPPSRLPHHQAMAASSAAAADGTTTTTTTTTLKGSGALLRTKSSSALRWAILVCASLLMLSNYYVYDIPASL